MPTGMATLNEEVRRRTHDNPPGRTRPPQQCYCGGWMPGSTAGGTPAATVNRYNPIGIARVTPRSLGVRFNRKH